MGDEHETAVRVLIGTAGTALDRIRRATTVLTAGEHIRDEQIEQARAAGHTWDEIGAAMGITGQAAGRHARRAQLADTPPPKPESRRARRRRLAAAHGALMLHRADGDVDQADAEFRMFYGRPLPAEAHTADPYSLPVGYARQRWPVSRAPAP